jgi:hypothetical protein
MQAEAGVKPQSSGILNPQTASAAQDSVQSTDKTPEMDMTIQQELEAHLNSVPDVQKAFIAEALQKAPDIVIPFVGIVAGPEVMQYFVQIHDMYLKQDSAAGAAPTEGAQPQPSNGSIMQPSVTPKDTSVLQPQQAKATPTM